jgi:hypothetical protein
MARIYPSLGSLQNQVNSPNYGILNAPILHLPLQNNLNPVAGVGTIEFIRASEGSYINRYGLISTANIDEPRFEKNGLLIESRATNSILWSENFGKTDWVKTNATILAANGNLDPVSPTNVKTAWALQDNSVSSTHLVYQEITLPVPERGTTHTASVFLAKGTAEFAKVILRSGNSIYSYSVIVDLNTGSTFEETSTDATGTVITNTNISVTKILNGWYRVALTAKFPDTIPTLGLEVRMVSQVGDSYTDTYNNIVLSHFYIWGGQIEQNFFATSYIVTDNTTSTRSGDTVLMRMGTTTINFPTTQNTYVMDFDILGTRHDHFRDVFSLGGFQYNIMRVDGYGNHIAFYDASGISDNTPLEANFLHRAAVRYNDGRYSLFRNGFEVASKTANPHTIGTPSGIIYIGNSNDNILNGHITNFRIYDTALTNDEIRII